MITRDRLRQSNGVQPWRMTPEPLARWQARPAAERASARAFLDLAERLSPYGTDPSLLDDLVAAAEDERRHAALCEQVLCRFGPVSTGSVPTLPPARSTDAGVALVEHVVFLLCAGEAVASALLTEAALRASQPGIADLLRTIALDESRHWRLGWRVLHGLLPALPRNERAQAGRLAPHQAIRAVVAAERVPQPGPDGEAWGVLSPKVTSKVARQTMKEVIGPRLAEVGLWNP